MKGEKTAETTYLILYVDVESEVQQPGHFPDVIIRNRGKHPLCPFLRGYVLLFRVASNRKKEVTSSKPIARRGGISSTAVR